MCIDTRVLQHSILAVLTSMCTSYTGLYLGTVSYCLLLWRHYYECVYIELLWAFNCVCDSIDYMSTAHINTEWWIKGNPIRILAIGLH